MVIIESTARLIILSVEANKCLLCKASVCLKRAEINSISIFPTTAGFSPTSSSYNLLSHYVFMARKEEAQLSTESHTEIDEVKYNSCFPNVEYTLFQGTFDLDIH